MLDAEILKAAPQFEVPGGLPEGPWQITYGDPDKRQASQVRDAGGYLLATVWTRNTDEQHRFARAIAAIPAMVEEIGRLREALKPFSDFAERIEKERPGWFHDGFSFMHSVNSEYDIPMKWLIAAHTLLAKSESQSATIQPRIPGLPAQAPTATSTQPAPGGIIETEKGP